MKMKQMSRSFAIALYFSFICTASSLKVHPKSDETGSWIKTVTQILHPFDGFLSFAGSEASKDSTGATTVAAHREVKAKGIRRSAHRSRKLGGSKAKRHSRGNSSSHDPSLVLHLFDEACSSLKDSCLRKVGSPVHRSALALGFKEPIPALHGDSEYYPMYISLDESVAESLFKSGHSSLTWPSSSCGKLSFTDFAADVVMVDLDEWKGENCEFETLLPELVRLVAVGGQLVFAKPPKAHDMKFIKRSADRFPSLMTTKFSNVFDKSNARSSKLRDCETCTLDRKTTDECQPVLQANYVPVTDASRKDNILKEKDLSMGRLRHWPVENVLKTQKEESWTDRTNRDMNGWFASNYVKSQNIEKKELNSEVIELMKNSKSLLDAGAGSCTLEALLREQGMFDHFHPMIAFGAYDCSMLRICAERGTISFQHDWLNPLPLCKECKFDFVIQLEGMHHVQSAESVETTVANFDARVACDGWLYMVDLPSNNKEINWRQVSADKMKTVGNYAFKQNSESGGLHYILAQKKC